MLNPASWHIWGIKSCQEQIKNEKVMAPENRGGSKTQDNKPQPILEHPKTSFYVALLLL
jgi:hypothetical protein